MPTSGRQGGKRNGRPGASYGNRSDLQQAPRAVPGQPYGVAGQQLQAQQAVPLSQTPPPNPQPQGQPQQGPVPGALGQLHAPSDRPNEPITAGLSQGPGPGPEALGGSVTPPDPTIGLLKGLFAAYPNADIQALLNQASNNTTTR